MASDFFGTRAAYKQATAKKQQQQSKAGKASKKGRRDELEDDEDDEEDMEMDEDEDFDEFDDNEDEEASQQDEDDEDEGSDAEDDNADDDNNEQQNKLPLSSYEKRKQKLSAETAELEAQLLQPKGWDMRGESRGKDRPTDSLLNVSADIER
jgi:U3 small nucleolar RNA-associated protein MPP10